MATKLAAKPRKKIGGRAIKAKAKIPTPAKSLHVKNKPVKSGKTGKTGSVKLPAKAAKPSSVRLKKTAKPSKTLSGKPTKMKASSPRSARPSAKASPVSKPIPAQKPKPLAGALLAFETGIKAMYAENYEKAIKSFSELIESYPEEPEIQASAKARIHTCEMKLHEQSRSVFRSADDHYNIAVALMNRRELDSALTHLQHALKLAPKGDHILYAMAVANALRGNRDQALSYLKQSIHHRPENRFQAAKDNDFAVLTDEPGFRELLTAPEK